MTTAAQRDAQLVAQAAAIKALQDGLAKETADRKAADAALAAAIKALQSTPPPTAFSDAFAPSFD